MAAKQKCLLILQKKNIIILFENKWKLKGI